jgi:ASC-1-like (ASCH) protein
MQHYLKIVDPYYQQVASGLKTFEVRENDRNFKVGDRVVLLRYNTETKQYFKSQTIIIEITYILSGFHAIKEGYVIFGFKKIYQSL